MNRRMWLISGVVVIFILAGLLFVKLRSGESAEKEEHHEPNVVGMTEEGQRNIELQVATATEERVSQLVKATGVVTPDEARQAHVFPLARGVVEQVLVRLGDRVSRGQALLRYDNIELGELVGEHLSVHSDVERERAQREVATRSLERAKVLIEKEAISQREFEVRRAEKQQADAALESTQADLAKVEEKLHRFGLSEKDIEELRGGSGHRTASHSNLRAPLAGVITKFDVAPGELVSPEKDLFTIVDTSTVWVLADIYEKDIGLVPQRGECTVHLASYVGETFRGEITYLSDFLDPASRTAKLRCIVQNPAGRLKLEMFADVFVATKQQRAVITVPQTAIQDVNGETSVFVQKGATEFERRTVKLGERGAKRIQVLEGLQSGEKVVTNGSFQLKTEAMRELIGDEH